MRECDGTGMRVLDVNGLGDEAVIVDIEPVPLLLLDGGLSCDRRMEILSRVIAERPA